MLNTRNLCVVIIFIFYLLIGVYLAITNGISHDQYHEQLNWIINFDAIKSLFNNDDGYQKLLNYKDKYHGIAFHYFSQPIQFLTNNLIAKINHVNIEYAQYISKHLAVFLSFNIAGIFFYLLSIKLTDSKNFALITTSIFFVSRDQPLSENVLLKILIFVLENAYIVECCGLSLPFCVLCWKLYSGD